MKSSTIVLVTALVTLLASACAPAQPIIEPVAVIEAFYKAINDDDLDTAMSFVADDAKFMFVLTYTGKAEIRTIFQDVRDLGIERELSVSDLQADGDKVSWMLETIIVGAGSYYASYEGVVQDGVIVFVTFTDS